MITLCAGCSPAPGLVGRDGALLQSVAIAAGPSTELRAPQPQQAVTGQTALSQSRGRRSNARAEASKWKTPAHRVELDARDCENG